MSGWLAGCYLALIGKLACYSITRMVNALNRCWRAAAVLLLWLAAVLWKACVLAAMERARLGWLAGWLGCLGWLLGWLVGV